MESTNGGKELVERAFTIEELEKEGMDIQSKPVTPHAHKWLVSEKLDPKVERNGFNKRLRYTVLLGRATNFGRQLTLAETKEAVNWLRERVREEEKAAEEYKKRRDVQKDTSAPEGDFNKDGETTNCKACEAATPVVSWAAMKNGKVLEDDEGKTIRNGIFYNVVEDGKVVQIPLCRECGTEYRNSLAPHTDPRLFYSYPYGEAVKKASEVEADMEKATRDEERRRERLSNFSNSVNASAPVNRSAKLGFHGTRRDRGDRR